MLGHVRPHTRRDVMIDGAQDLDLDAVASQDDSTGVDETTGVRELR